MRSVRKVRSGRSGTLWSQIGNEAISIIVEDNCTVDKMNGTLDDMQSELQIANKVCLMFEKFEIFKEIPIIVSFFLFFCCFPLQRLTRFAKSMFTDKLILLFVCLIVTVVVGIVVYSFMGGNDS